MNRKQRPNCLGAALREARETAGMGQVPLSLAMDYEYNAVSAWENGSKPLYPHEWPELCALLPGLDPALALVHAGEFSLDQGRKLKPRPSRLDPRTTQALNEVVQAKASGMAATEVARAAGLDYLGFWKMLKGQANPTLVQLGLLADYFQVDVDVLLGRRPVAAPTYAALLALAGQQRARIEELAGAARDGERIRELNDLLLAGR